MAVGSLTALGRSRLSPVIPAPWYLWSPGIFAGSADSKSPRNVWADVVNAHHLVTRSMVSNAPCSIPLRRPSSFLLEPVRKLRIYLWLAQAVKHPSTTTIARDSWRLNDPAFFVAPLQRGPNSAAAVGLSFHTQDRIGQIALLPEQRSHGRERPGGCELSIAHKFTEAQGLH